MNCFVTFLLFIRDFHLYYIARWIEFEKAPFMVGTCEEMLIQVLPTETASG